MKASFICTPPPSAPKNESTTGRNDRYEKDGGCTLFHNALRSEIVKNNKLTSVC